MRGVRWIALCLVLGGAGLFFAGLRMPLYRDADEFGRRSAQLGPGKSSEYRELRRRFLTPGIAYQDYGLTLAIAGLSLPWVVGWRDIVRKLPDRKATIFWFGIAAALFTVSTETATLFLDQAREEFPWWADSIIIPLMGMPVVFVALCGWAGAHSLMATDVPSVGAKIIGAWVSCLVIFSAAYLGYSIFAGEFWALGHASLWLGFYVAIWRTRYRCWAEVTLRSCPQG